MFAEILDLPPWELESIISDIGVYALIIIMMLVIYELIKTTKPGKMGALIIIGVLMASPIVYFIKTLVVTFTNLQEINMKKMIYESPDGGKTVYAREFGAPASTRKLLKDIKETK